MKLVVLLASAVGLALVGHVLTAVTCAVVAVADWIDFYNRNRRHTRAGLRSPVDYELAAREQTEAA